MLSSLTKIFQILSKQEKRSFLFISLLLIIGMFFEIFGLGLVFPFILSLLNPDKISGVDFFDQFISGLEVSKTYDFTTIILLLLVLAYLAKTIFMVYLAYRQNKFVSNITANLSNKLYSTYLKQPLNFHNKNNSSTLIKNIQIEVAYVKSFCMSFITIAIELSLAISIFITIFFVETIGALILGVYFLILSFLYFQIVKPIIIRWGVDREQTVKKISKTLVEGINAIRELILFQAISSYISSYINYNKKLVSLNTKSGTFQQIPRLFLELFSIIGIVIFVSFLLLNGKDNTYVISIIGVFVAAIFRLLPSINRVLNALQNIKYYTPSIDVIYSELFNNNLDLKLVEEKEVVFDDKIEIKNLYFKYLKDETNWNLEKINLSINKGDFIGIKGVSGSGKSTLIDLFAGLDHPDKGEFLIDGKFTNLNNSKWREQIGYVSQNVMLIDDTILTNITLGKNNSNIDFERVESVIKKAGLKEFVNSLKDGYETVVGERGVQISGGQKQRIGLARALFQNPKILILDEATSALDNETEKKIMDSIFSIRENMTVLIVAHRLSTLKKCDCIYELRNQKLKKVS